MIADQQTLAPAAVASTGFAVTAGSPLIKHSIAAGLITMPAAKSLALCSHHSCKRPAADGVKYCEHHRALQYARWKRWAEKHK